VHVPKHLVEWDIIGSDPAYPGEDTESLEDVSGEEVPEESAREAIYEESLSGYAAAISDTGVLLRV